MRSLAPNQGKVNTGGQSSSGNLWRPDGIEALDEPRLSGSSRPRPGADPVSLETRETSEHLSRSRRRVRPQKKAVSVEESREQRRARAGWEHATVIRSLRACGRQDEALDMERCNRLIVYDCGGCGERSGRVYFTCKNRVCTYCLRARAERIAKKLVDLVTEFFNPVMVVLTIKNRHDLASADKHLRSSFKKLCRRELFRANFRGGFVFWETSYNALSSEWHVHLHCLMDGRMPRQLLSDLWFDCTGDSYIVDISYIYPEEKRGAIVEACKYPCKLSTIVASPGVLNEYLAYIKGRRLFWSFGSCYGLSAQLVAVEEAEEYEELPEDKEICPACGVLGEMQQVPGAVLYRGQCYPDKRGWWRLARPPGGGDLPSDSS